MSDVEILARTLQADGHQIQYEVQYLQQPDRSWRQVGEKIWHYALCPRCVELRREV